MFVLNITYLKSLDQIEPHLAEHRAFIKDCCQKGYFLMAGPKEPRTGGIVIATLEDQGELEKLLAQDPYIIYELAQYDFIKFKPVNAHPDFSHFIK